MRAVQLSLSAAILSLAAFASCSSTGASNAQVTEDASPSTPIEQDSGSSNTDAAIEISEDCAKTCEKAVGANCTGQDQCAASCEASHALVPDVCMKIWQTLMTCNQEHGILHGCDRNGQATFTGCETESTVLATCLRSHSADAGPTGPSTCGGESAGTSACRRCGFENCCDQEIKCRSDVECVKYNNCLKACAATDDACMDQCDRDYRAGQVTSMQLAQCIFSHCSGECF